LQWDLGWGTVCLGAGLTALGGMLPDLDSKSGVPLREMSGLAAVATPFLLLHRLQASGFSLDEKLVILGGIFVFIKYAAGAVINFFTVHRGMFHSVPGMLIAGLSVFLLYHNPKMDVRFYMAGGVMLGFLSHLVLDEMCSVDFSGARVRLSKSAGSALKFHSSGWLPTLTTYLVLAGLVYMASLELQHNGTSWQLLERRFWETLAGNPSR
jgi:membrane-bound metal-dependent hydrolase YbcI (DUF457 family)